jgi:hypothetical protein
VNSDQWSEAAIGGSRILGFESELKAFEREAGVQRFEEVSTRKMQRSDH